jgi:hypothetical protein
MYCHLHLDSEVAQSREEPLGQTGLVVLRDALVAEVGPHGEKEIVVRWPALTVRSKRAIR